MSAETLEERRAALAAWCAASASLGQTLPPTDIIEAFANTGSGLMTQLRASTDARVLRWMPTFEFFAKQWKFGNRFPDPSSALLIPVSESPSEQGQSHADPSTGGRSAEVVQTEDAEIQTETAADQTEKATDVESETRMAMLRRVRAELQAAGEENIAAVKDSHLARMVSSKAVTASDVALVLTASTKRFAEKFAAALAGTPDLVAAQGEVAATATSNTSTAAPVSPHDQRVTQDQPAETQTSVGSDPVPVPVAREETAISAAEPEAPQPTVPLSAATTADASGVVGGGEFALCDYTATAGVTVPLRAIIAPDLALVLAWDAYASADSVVIYRVVTDDVHPIYNPDVATLVAATTSLTVRDERPFVSAIRFAQVWVNTGSTVAAAKSAQPVLHAEQWIVAPPQQVDIREDGRRVVGEWVTFPGVERVHVRRVPMEAGPAGAGLPQHRILEAYDNLGGFVDTEAAKGRHHLYQVLAEASHSGVSKLSQPIDKAVLVPDVIEPVLDLQVTEVSTPEGLQFDLSWTTPRGGQVVIFRTEEPPNPEAELEASQEAALGQMGLAPEERLRHPVDRAEGRSLLRNVPWPDKWTRAYFTPVTILNGVAHVGRPVVHVYVPEIRSVRLVERVNKQVLTFAFPTGVSSVLVYEGALGTPIEAIIEGSPPLEVTATQYIERGGFTFPRLLPSSKGCLVVLVPVAFSGGSRITGRPISIEYPKLLRVKYETKILRTMVGGVAGVSLTLRSDAVVNWFPGFVLVHNPERFPLSKEDGKVLMMVPEAVEAPIPTRVVSTGALSPTPSAPWRTHAETWKTEVPKPRGWVRLFADLPPEAMSGVAVLDPAPSSLRLQPLLGK